MVGRYTSIKALERFWVETGEGDGVRRGVTGGEGGEGEKGGDCIALLLLRHEKLFLADCYCII